MIRLRRASVIAVLSQLAGAATVEGTFVTVKWRVRASYSVEEITAHNVIWLPHTVDPRGPKGK